MLRAIVIGSPGAGKSTFARKLRDKTGLPLYCLDLLWHKPDQTTHTKVEFDFALQPILQKDNWIIDGNYQRTLEQRLQRCDTVFLLDYPVEICLAGAKSRIGKVREDLPWVETSFDPEFKEFIENFSQDELPQIYSKIDKYRNKLNVIVFKSRDEANEYLKNI